MSGRFWNWLILFLIIVILVGGLVIWSKYTPGQPVEIELSPRRQIAGDVHVSGAIVRPGIYPLREDDTLDDILQAAGGIKSDADPDRIEIHVPNIAEEKQPQKVNINRADVWLLQALPEIGKTRAQTIVDYREKNGPFKSIDDLTRVAGIGEDSLKKIRHLITVTD
ncbi:MAG: ComEA family DNA-binding protein [Chloroflexota bacterium]